jgi:hypothetical protein
MANYEDYLKFCEGIGVSREQAGKISGYHLELSARTKANRLKLIRKLLDKLFDEISDLK